MNKLFYLMLFLLFFCSTGYSDQLADENFDDQDATDTFDMTYSRAAYTDLNSTYSRSGSYAMEIEATPDYGTLWWPNNGSGDGAEYYVSMWLYFPTGWDWDNISLDTGLKITQGRQIGTPAPGQPADMIKRGECDTSQLTIHGGFLGTECDSEWGSCFDEPAIGQWHHFEYYISYNSNSSLGGMWIKVNDETVQDFTCDTITGRQMAPTAISMPTYNGRGSNGSYWVDDIEIWDEIPDAVEVKTFHGLSGSGFSIGE